MVFLLFNLSFNILHTIPNKRSQNINIPEENNMQKKLISIHIVEKEYTLLQCGQTYSIHVFTRVLPLHTHNKR